MIDTDLLHNILRQPVFQVVNFKDEVEILRKSCILSVLKQHVRRVRSDCLEATFPFLTINVDVVGIECVTLSRAPQKWIVPPSSLISSRKLPTTSDTVYN